MELLTIELEDLIEILPSEIWDEYKAQILERGSLEEPLPDDRVIQFSKAYMLFRRKHHHKGVKLIKKGSTQWKTVVELTRYIQEVFCIENSMGFEEGVTNYLSGGWAMGCVTLRDFLYKGDSIGKDAELRAEIMGDENKDITAQLLELYYEEGFTRAGSIKFKLREAKHRVYFVRIAKELVQYNITPQTFITEFFDEWNWLGGWPKPVLLTSDYTFDLLKKIAEGLNVQKPETTGIYIKITKNGNRRDQ